MFQECLESCFQCFQMDPYILDIYIQMGYTYRNGFNDNDSALILFQCSIDICILTQNKDKNLLSMAQRHLGIILLEKRNQEGFLHLENSVRTYPDDFRKSKIFEFTSKVNWYVIAVWHFKHGEFQKSVDEFSNSIKYSPSKLCNFNSFFWRGKAHGRLGNIQESLDDFFTGLECKEFKDEFHYNIGNVFQEMENYEEAMKHYDQCINIDPDWIKNFAILRCISKLNSISNHEN
jgi:tetratricopeptide (TPR) repeat protein